MRGVSLVQDLGRRSQVVYDPDQYGRAGAATSGPPVDPLLELSDAVAEEQAERIAANGEAPVAPISPGNGVYHRLKHMLSPWRWAMGGEDLLRRAGLHDLADSLREYYDAESVLLGGFFSSYREMSESYTYDEWAEAQEEFKEYMQLRERGYKMPEELVKYQEEAEKYLNEKVGKAGKELIAWQKKQAVFTGKLSTELNVHVYDPNISQAPGFKMVPDGKGGWTK